MNLFLIVFYMVLAFALISVAVYFGNAELIKINTPG